MSIEFGNQESYAIWIGEVEGIKQHAADIQGGSNQQYQVWLDRVMSFRSMCGDQMVPLDIQRAVNSVEDGIGVDRTLWN